MGNGRLSSLFNSVKMLVADCVYGASIRTGTAVNAGVGIDRPFASGFTDSADRTGIVTCATVDALVRNGVSQAIHLPFC